MEYIEKFFRYSHILAGVIVLISGIMAIAFNPKGNRLHKKIGITYFYGMLWIFLSSCTLNYFKFNFFLLMISVFSFYLCFSGYRTIKRKTPEQVKLWDWLGALITLLAGICYIVFGILLITQDKSTTFALLSIFFGAFSIRIAYQDISIFNKKEYDEKMWWYFQHAGIMMGSFIAATTAFAVNVLPRLTPDSSLNWVYWILPTIIGLPLISNILKNEKAKSKK